MLIEEYVKNEKDKNMLLTATTLSEEDLSIQYTLLEIYLNTLTKLYDFEIILKDKRTYKLDTSKYVVRVAILDSGDYCFYTINKRTNQKGNYRRALSFRAFKFSLEKFVL